MAQNPSRKLKITDNSVSSPPPPILQDRDPVAMLEHWAKTRPNAVYLRQPKNGEWLEYTWQTVYDQAARVASGLRKLGVEPGDVVALSGRNTAHWIMADMAIAMAGAISVALYPKQAVEASQYVLEHSGAKGIFLGPLENMAEVNDAVLDGMFTIGLPYDEVETSDHSWDQLVAAHDPIENVEARDPNATWAMVYTSGTTGKPKGVMLTGKASKMSINGTIDRLGFGDDERFFSYLPLSHIFERGVVEQCSIYLGAQVSFMESLDKLGEQLAEVAPTRFYGVPVVYGRIQGQILQKMPQKKLDRLLRLPIIGNIVRKKIVHKLGLQNARMVVSGAAPLAESVISWFDKLGIQIMQGYGMSENSAYCTVNLPDENKLGSVGRPMPGVDIKIDPETQEILTRGATMSGYYKNQEKTDETIEPDGWLHTGDKGRIDKDGYLFITGRVKDAFKTAKGKYVDPAPIEDRLARNSAIDQLCLVGSGLKQPIAVVRLDTSEDEETLAAELRKDLQALNHKLEPHERIACMLLTRDEWTPDNGLMTPTMKIKRAQLETRYRSEIEKAVESHNKGDDPIIWM